VYIGNQPATGENNSFKILDDITSYTLTFNGSYASVVSLANDTITKNEHRFITGQRVTYTHGGGTAIGGLTSGSVYYIVKNDQNTIKLAPSYADAIGSTNLINFTSLGTGSSHTLNVAFDGINTKFKATYDNGTKAGITRAAQLQISINGVIQRPYDSVTPPSGFGIDLDSVIVFSTAPIVSDVFWGNLVANNFPTFDISDNEIDNFIGDATTVSYTLSKTPANSQNILVTLDGVVQYPSDNDTTRAYTLSENVLTFDSAPGSGVFIQVRHIGFAGATSSEVTGFYGRTGNVALRYIDNVKVGNIDSVGFSTFTATGIGTVRIGIGTTALLVEGNARVTGILTVGNSSITIDGNTNKINIGGETTFIQNGAIGIGTTNLDGNALKVIGSTSVSGILTVGGDATVGGNISLKSLDYAGISSTISGTAVDVFVYDTSKDSDGGAWRYKTQRTSWYNETLNTATRGSRREFPAVAVILIHTTSNSGDTLSIYDGDDPDLPLWMRFNGGGIVYASSGSSVYMLNGLMCAGNNFATGVQLINFISDSVKGYRTTSTTTYQGNWKSNIAGRNLSSTNWDGIAFNPTIISGVVNDVAMTVLPNAPIDSATGLPIPTIAVATNGGVSVIKDDGTVVDIGSNIGTTVDFTEDNNIIIGLDYYGNGYLGPIPSADISDTSYRTDYIWFQPGGGGNITHLGPDASTDEVYVNRKALYSSEGLSFYNADLVGFTTSASAVAYATTSYNTGWMHGNIKGAFLSDTTVESLTANTNLVSNFTQVATDRLTSETYDDGDTSWQMVDNAATINGYLIIKMIGLTIGQSYIISMTWDNNAALDVGYDHQVIHKRGLAGQNSTSINHWNKTNASSETLTFVFTAQSVNDDCLSIYANAITLNVSNFIVRAVDDEDRSVNNKGLQVFGTITKSAVATGAELVAYSNWNIEGNYLAQPYNSGLDFSTGDFSLMAWIYPTANNSIYKGIISRGSNGVYGPYALTYNNQRITFVASNDWNETNDTGSWGTLIQTVDGSVPINVWSHVVVRHSGTTTTVYINGQPIASDTSAVNPKAPTTNFIPTMIGVERTPLTGAIGRPFVGSLALIRASASAPSAEQIKKIYEDEKVLFQENANATLYGSSNAVTALAYDEKANLLHVGTSSGRSDFNGLRRINNTTTAVTTAISAYDGSIAQQ